MYLQQPPQSQPSPWEYRRTGLLHFVPLHPHHRCLPLHSPLLPSSLWHQECRIASQLADLYQLQLSSPFPEHLPSYRLCPYRYHRLEVRIRQQPRFCQPDWCLRSQSMESRKRAGSGHWKRVLPFQIHPFPSSILVKHVPLLQDLCCTSSWKLCWCARSPNPSISMSRRKLIGSQFTSCWKPSSCTMPEFRCRIFTSKPFDALLHCAPPMLLASRVKVSPPFDGFQPKPVSANRHLPDSFDKSRYMLSKLSLPSDVSNLSSGQWVH